MRLIADIGAYNMLLTAAIPTLTMLMANAHLRHPGDPHDAHRGLHQQDADRRLSRRRPSRGDLLRRARDGHAGARAEDGSRRSCAGKNFIQPDKFPFATQMGAVYDSGDYEQGARPRARRRRTGTALKAERDAARSRGPAGRPRPGDVRRGLRPRPVVVAADRRLGALAGHHRARRPHQRHHRRVAARPGQRDDVRADAGRSVRRADRAHHDPSRRHRRREAGHRHVRQPLAGGRRHGAAPGRRQGEGEDGEVRRGAARSARGRHRLRERHDRREGRAGVRASRSPRSPATPTCRCRCRRASSRA